jgi:hypothetical protein
MHCGRCIETRAGVKNCSHGRRVCLARFGFGTTDVTYFAGYREAARLATTGCRSSRRWTLGWPSRSPAWRSLHERGPSQAPRRQGSVVRFEALMARHSLLFIVEQLCTQGLTLRDFLWAFLRFGWVFGRVRTLGRRVAIATSKGMIAAAFRRLRRPSLLVDWRGERLRAPAG